MMIMLMDLAFCLETLSLNSNDLRVSESKGSCVSWHEMKFFFFFILISSPNLNFRFFVSGVWKCKKHKTIFTELHVVACDFFVCTPRHTVGTDVGTGV